STRPAADLPRATRPSPTRSRGRRPAGRGRNRPRTSSPVGTLGEQAAKRLPPPLGAARANRAAGKRRHGGSCRAVRVRRAIERRLLPRPHSRGGLNPRDDLVTVADQQHFTRTHSAQVFAQPTPLTRARSARGPTRLAAPDQAGTRRTFPCARAP